MLNGTDFTTYGNAAANYTNIYVAHMVEEYLDDEDSANITTYSCDNTQSGSNLTEGESYCIHQWVQGSSSGLQWNSPVHTCIPQTQMYPSCAPGSNSVSVNNTVTCEVNPKVTMKLDDWYNDILAEHQEELAEQ
mmetsp:Transcript_45266/g.61397  ORF Transcript_45266/g.61397 Transcript_45266/m.61397 type:complete len:134 (-) Transcript_45266:154-555(-)|eukprot:CAMPEP_0176366142 /NCGR_PEP_ID=MMETSP0126-20121128/20972_1 /TAXON_ID=141414 ORGANISM="Strombidinopsis acuminatum, Strain SPMC142" /NCGR_SAMPLE_ID=MMETSP0126 /ASSEMBLY_ACC=CAM_ASM_000229 /LENGTH=133 /DNA_ID=CAMNT_0017723443 /DNA_START=269 /DNA_END=670 /DNA_ORIENTATION=+